MIDGYAVYYRVSTKSQGESGLSLDAQQALIHHYLKLEDIRIEYTEVASAKTVQERPVLLEAIEYCREHNLGLAIAKVDRLSSNTEQALSVFEQLNKYLFTCDIPMQPYQQADKFTLTLFLAIADRERELISIRTKQALDQRIIHKGEWRESFLNDEHRSKGSLANVESAKQAYKLTQGYVAMLDEKGLSLREIA